ncbi:hypothetical protein, partial [Acinetobacter baumannii]|uniref:hypothetical protein n=1 Tax=Acinetobacter baumannii TaxID=470 RepID=UPI000B0A67FD
EDMPTTAQGIDVRGTVVTTGDQISITDAIDTASQCILSHAPTDDWSAFALARAGKSVPQAYIPQEEQRLTDAGGVFQDVTEYARMALAVQAAGGNPAALAGYDTIEKMY